jgi:hypothetical protein
MRKSSGLAAARGLGVVGHDGDRANADLVQRLGLCH